MHEELIELSNRLLRAIQSRDARALAEILADDFQHFDSSGAAVGKKAFTAGVLEAPFEVLSIGFEVIEVRQVDCAAVVVGVQRAQVRMPAGDEVTSRGAFTDIFTRAGDAWVIRLAHSVDL